MANGTPAFMAYRPDRLISAFVAGLLLWPGQALAAKMLADTELQGKSYRSFELIAPVPDFCRKVCEKDGTCKGWMFSWPGKKGKRAKCFLFSEITEQRKDTCCIAGLPAKKKQQPETPTTTEGEAEKGNETAARPETSPPATSKPKSYAGKVTAEPVEPVPAIEQKPTTQPATPNIVEDAALAEKRAFCTSYAKTAMQANRRARELGCGFSGGLWGASRNGYFNWCMKNPPQAAEKNTRRRALALRRCEREVARSAPTERRPSWEDDFPPWPEEEPRAYPPRRDVPVRRWPWQDARYIYSWLKRSGPGPRRTPWRPTLSGNCVLVRACDCPQGNTCRVYPPGSIAIAWPAGCDGPPAYYVCRVRRR